MTDLKQKNLCDVYIVDKTSLVATLRKIVDLGEPEAKAQAKIKKDVKDMTLGELREKLTSANALTWRQQGCSFCNKAGAVFNDSLSFATYIQALDHGSGEPPSKDKPTKPNAEVNTPELTEHHAVYLMSRKVPTEQDVNETKNFLKEKMGFDLKKTELLAGKDSQQLQSTFNHSDYMARAGSSSITKPADMLERHWNIVMNTNSLLSGSSAVVRNVDIGVRVERAMYPAFRLKGRAFEDYEVALDNSSGINVSTHNLHIPRYIVADDSYVEVTESKSSVATAVASSSLTQIDAELAVGGGAYGYSAGVSASHHSTEETKKLVKKQSDTKRMVITYNFPRVIVLLDKDSLEVTKECIEDVKTVNGWTTLSRFLNKYGSFFATRVELGGRLHSSEDSTAITGQTVSEKAKTMKDAAGLSVSGPAVNVSAKGGKGTDDKSSDDKTNSSLNNNMSWEAKGGDTLLCNNPAEWCNTVASFYNWRVVKQEELVAIEDLIDSIQGDIAVRDQFNAIRNASHQEPGQLEICFYQATLSKYMSLHADRTTTIMYMRSSANDDTENFLLHGVVPTYNGIQRIMRQNLYTLFNKMSQTWVHGKSSGVLNMPVLHHGATKDQAWQFKIEPVDPEKNTAGVLGQDVVVRITAFDQDGNKKGVLSHIPGNGIYEDALCVGTAIGVIPRDFKLRYQ